MSDIFIAHVEEDADVALEIAVGLEEAGYTTWCYEVDSIPGPSYLIQTGKAVEASKAVVVVISPHSVGSRQVTKEIVRAHESGKEFVPVLHGITHIEFQNRQPEWREAIGGAASISIPLEGVAGIIPRIVSGLKALDINPRSKTEAARMVQIRKVLGELHGRSILEKAELPPVPVEESRKEERGINEIAEIAKEEEKPVQVTRRLTRSPWFWAGVVLLTFTVIILLGMASEYPQMTSESERFGLSMGVLVISLPIMLLGTYFLKRGLSQSLHSKNAWFRSAYVLLPAGVLLVFIVTAILFSSPPAPSRHVLFLVLTGTVLPVIIVGGYCLRRGIKM